jgi:hypothetical protein
LKEKVFKLTLKQYHGDAFIWNWNFHSFYGIEPSMTISCHNLHLPTCGATWTAFNILSTDFVNGHRNVSITLTSEKEVSAATFLIGCPDSKCGDSFDIVENLQYTNHLLFVRISPFRK